MEDVESVFCKNQCILFRQQNLPGLFLPGSPGQEAGPAFGAGSEGAVQAGTSQSATDQAREETPETAENVPEAKAEADGQQAQDGVRG